MSITITEILLRQLNASCEFYPKKVTISSARTLLISSIEPEPRFPWASKKLNIVKSSADVDYKAILSGSLAVKVPAQLTSQCCPKCGHVSKENRPNKGLTFRCSACSHTLHSDLVGARNVALRTLLAYGNPIQLIVLTRTEVIYIFLN